MNGMQTRLLAEHTLAALACAAGVHVEMVRGARDDATAPHAEIPAAALRRVWLWAVSGVATSQSAAALACGVSRPTVRRAREAVTAWYDRPGFADVATAAAELAESLAFAIVEGPALLSAATRAALSDRSELAKRRTSARARRKVTPTAPRAPIRARDLHRVRAPAYGL